jgi:hypothetical protein
MRILLEIFLTVCEWVQEWNIQRSARKAAREYEKKTILTFLSQAAVGGALALIVQVAYSIIANPSGYNIIMVGGLPIYSIGGAAAGAFTGVFIWLLEASLNRLRFTTRKNPSANASTTRLVLLNRTFRFVGRTIIGMVVMPSLLFAFYYVMEKRELAQLSYSWWLGFSCTMGLAIGLVTGSSIRPCRTLIFGVEGRPVRSNFGNWLSIPFGFLLRALSVLGLLEALMVMALWISNRRVNTDWFPVREQLPAVVCAILYFAASTYFSFKTPRKPFLLLTAIFLNLPLVPWIANLGLGEGDSAFMAYSLAVFICLWALYTLGRLIAPESGWRVGDSGSETAAGRVTHGGECSVHL